ncbi:MAG: hypothetical protein K2Y42_03245 [Hyphomicrobium sp.]|jgi:hypothetical protein|uniref:hypothetical protein n=1 Tax=Hyphomicrobium sp. TaxID=82 RepID=UPI0025C3526F|nr:hypothetical protein [Hyphomicrobium sp.]MBX9861746.1 hypothetical protein [Hyphomicrobium sp.]
MTSTAQRRRMPLAASLLMLGAGALFFAAPATAAGAGGETQIEGAQEAAPPPIDMTAEWPCVQRKVESVSVGQVWDGPPTENVKGWFRDKDISNLIEVLASRRVPVADGEGAIKKFAEAQPEDKRDAQLTLLFAGLFDKITSQRRTVMSGILKYQKSQKERARELEHQSTAIGQLESKLPPGIVDDTPELAAAREKFNWAQRIFQERQSSMPLACELPVLIEERLYAFSRAIRANMKS